MLLNKPYLTTRIDHILKIFKQQKWLYQRCHSHMYRDVITSYAWVMKMWTNFVATCPIFACPVTHTQTWLNIQSSLMYNTAPPSFHIYKATATVTFCLQ